MFYLIGVDGREYGPFTPEQMRQWILDGRANNYSRVRRDGETTWQALGELPEFADATRPRLDTGTPPPAPTPEAIAAGYLQQPHQIDIEGAIRRGWALVRDHPSPLIGGSILVWLLSFGVALVPAVGWLAGLFLTGALHGGLYHLFIRRIRGEQVGAGDVFGGFGPGYVQLLLTSVVSALLVVCGMILCLVPGVYLLVGYIFALPLVIDKRMEFWTAMEVSRRVVHQHWWQMLLFGLVSCVIILVGVLACGVGVLVAAPVVTASMMYLYEDLFGRT
jgi:hypothetical protein